MYRVAENKHVQFNESTAESTQDIWKELDANFTAQKGFFEHTINKWSEHTQMNNQLHSKNKKSAFNLSIPDQVNQMLADQTSKQKLRQKSQ